MTKHSSVLTTFSILITMFILFIVGGYALINLARSDMQFSTERSVTIDDTISSKWSTFTNEEIGFEFQYPKDWEIVDGINELEIWSKDRVHLKDSGAIPDIIFKMDFSDMSITEWAEKLKNSKGYFEKQKERNGGIYLYQKGLVDGSSFLLFQAKGGILEVSFGGDIEMNDIYSAIADSINID